MASVFVKIQGRTVEEKDVATVAALREQYKGAGLSLEGYSASVNGEKVDPSRELSEGEAVVFTKDTKGGA